MGCASSRSSQRDASTPGGGRLLEEYAVGQTLGEGAFGVVYSCEHRRTGRQLAVKMVDKVETPVEAIQREADMLKSLNHQNIVRFHDVLYERCFVCIVMDKFDGGDLVEGLHKHIKEKGRINCLQVIHIHTQMAAAVQYLHRRNIVHRDIKGDNYLMDRPDFTDPQCHVVLTDFGTATTLEPGTRLSTEVGTRIFWAPEMFDKSYGLKVDIWAMGVVFYGLLNGRFPFKDELDIRMKPARIPKRTHPDCEDLVRCLLTKEENRRITADDVMAHRWISGLKKEDDPSEEPGVETTDSMQSEERIVHDAADDGVAERRRELMMRLDRQFTKVPKDKKKRAPQIRHFMARNFVITEKYTGATMRFEWRDRAEVRNAGLLLPEDGTDKLPEGAEMDRSPHIVGKMLQEHNIDISKFGVGQAKTLEQLAAEVQSGAARLMLDATDYKKLVRVVDVVLLKVFTRRTTGKKILIETEEEYPDGRSRTTFRLPGSKKEPHDSSIDVASRVLEELFETSCDVDFDFCEAEVFEEENESPSFPGVRTVYRKEVVPCYMRTADPVISPTNRVNAWKAKDSKQNIKSFAWMTEAEAEAKKVKLTAGRSEVSGLVMAPIGLNVEDLAAYLSANSVDISKFGKSSAKSLKEFSSELIKGECTLSLDSSGKVVRIVDLVMVKVLNPATNEVLVQTEQIMPDGTKMLQDRLPGAKRRPDESQFLTARRIIRRHLRMHENEVRLDPRRVRYFQEERSSSSFPGVRTVYRKRVIIAELTDIQAREGDESRT